MSKVKRWGKMGRKREEMEGKRASEGKKWGRRKREERERKGGRK